MTIDLTTNRITSHLLYESIEIQLEFIRFHRK